MPLTDTAARNAKPADKPFKLADGGGGQVVSAGANMVVLANLSLTKPAGSDLVIRCRANSIMPDGSIAAAVMTLQLLARRPALHLAQRATSRKALLKGVREAARNRS